MFISYALIILGVVFLLKNLGIISSSVWGIIWLLILILIGLYPLIKARRYRLFWEKIWKKLD